MDESGPRETRLLKCAIEEFFHDSTQTPMTESLLMAEPLLLLWVSAHSGGKQAPKIGDCVCCRIFVFQQKQKPSPPTPMHLLVC